MRIIGQRITFGGEGEGGGQTREIGALQWVGRGVVPRGPADAGVRLGNPAGVLPASGMMSPAP